MLEDKSSKDINEGSTAGYIIWEAEGNRLRLGCIKRARCRIRRKDRQGLINLEPASNDLPSLSENMLASEQTLSSLTKSRSSSDSPPESEKTSDFLTQVCDSSL